MDAIALPRELASYKSRIIDIDTHENMPIQEWIRHYGDEVRPIVDYFLERGESEEVNPNTANAPGYAGDVLPIDANIGNVKGVRAPGSVNPERRLDVMDAMGISRQLMFPTGLAIFTMNLFKYADTQNFMSTVRGDRLKTAKHWIDLANEWAVGAASVSERIRPVPVLYGDTPDELIAHATEFVKSGIRAVWIFPAGEPPGGVSPAHPDLDRLWALFAEANCTATIHIGGDGNFFASARWRDAPPFEGYIRHAEINMDPWYLASMHQPFENFLTVMLLGGVFDRHPNLSFGVIECGAHWVGPMIRRLDMWYATGGRTASTQVVKPTYRLPHPPSYYLKKHVRVTPFVFEDFAKDIDFFDLSDVLCFSTDYPHAEGGKNALATFYQKVSVLGPEKTEKFFVKNGELLLPA